MDMEDHMQYHILDLHILVLLNIMGPQNLHKEVEKILIFLIKYMHLVIIIMGKQHIVAIYINCNNYNKFYNFILIIILY